MPKNNLKPRSDESTVPGVDDTLTVIEASNVFDMHPDSIKQLIRRGKLPGAKLALLASGRAGYRIPVASLEKYLQRRKKRASPSSGN